MRRWRFVIVLWLFSTALSACSIPQLLGGPTDTAFKQRLSNIPLYEGTGRVYDYWAYALGKETTWRLVETETEMRMIDGLYAAKTDTTAEVISGGLIGAPFHFN